MGFFKAYDMRGTYGVDFDLDLVRRVGRALPRVVPGKAWLVGRDARASGGAIESALVEGLVAAGADVMRLGVTTTPTVYFATASGGYDGSVMVTASHNPPADNGLKVSRRGALPVGFADGLDRVERLAHEMPPLPPFVPVETPQSADVAARYVAWQREHAPFGPNGLKYAIDCSNGVAALYAKDLFPGAELVNDAIDGGFPSHAPNPLKASAREQLAALVREKRLDCGVVFDGDADRCVILDENGAFVQPDYLIPVVARAVLGERAKGAKVIHDVRTSRGVIETLREMGCEPVMVPVGHAFAKPALRTSGAACGGELAGHYYFADFFCCDSGILAARRILAEAARAKARGLAFSQMMAPIVTRYANSGELNFRVEDKDAAIGRLLAAAAANLPAERARSEIDGLRVEYDAGWFNVRKSNTEPYLRLVAEADTRERLEKHLDIFRKAIGGEQQT